MFDLRTRRATGYATILLLTFVSAAVAQDPHGYELGVQGVATISDASFVGGGLVGGMRTGGRTRIVFSVLSGRRDGNLAGRGELSFQYLLDPGRTRGWAFYGFGGIAGVAGPRSSGFLVLGLGVESAPGNRSGWILEGGVGGGARLSLGWRHRWLARPRTR